MILSPSILMPLISQEGIIENLSERELNTPEGAGFDLTVGQVNEIEGAGSLLIETRKTSNAKVIGRMNSCAEDGSNPILSLTGNSLYLVSTNERFKLAENMVAFFHPRSTLFRSGVIFQSGVAPYGYEGQMIFLLYVANPAGFELQLGARFAHVNIMSVAGESFPYQGQWQDGRVIVDKMEKQK